jgi:hypothetical protein
MSNEIKVIDEITRDKLVKALDLYGLHKAPENVKEQFIEIALTMKLNPFKREIYAVPFGGSYQVVVGYQIYLKRAEATGLLNGYTCEYLLNPNRVKVTIYRKDWQHPFVYEAFESEFIKDTPIWKKMPRLMMQKCAMSVAFRNCFPNEFAGIPYTEEEMQENQPKNVSPIPAKQQKENEIPPKTIEAAVDNVKKEFPGTKEVIAEGEGAHEKALNAIERAEYTMILMDIKTQISGLHWTDEESKHLSDRILKRLEFLIKTTVKTKTVCDKVSGLISKQQWNKEELDYINYVLAEKYRELEKMHA